MTETPLAGLPAAESFTLLDLIPIDELQHVQDSLAAATGVASVIVDLSGRCLTRPSNYSPVCRLVLASPVGRRRCALSSEQLLGRARRQPGPTHHRCLSCGFVDAAAPIIVEDRHIADWLIGQCDAHRVGSDRIRAFAREIGLDEEALAAAYERVAPIALDQFERHLDLLWNVAHELSELGYRNLCYRRELAERRQIEELLRRREGENHTLLDAMPDLVFQLSRGGVLEKCHGSREDMYRAPEQFIGKHVSEVLPPDVADITIQNLRQAAATGAVQVYEYSLPIGGRTRYFESRLLMGSPDSALAIVRDITERKRAEQEQARLHERLEKAERMEALGILAGGMAHDLNNMLGPLVGYPELILAKLPPDSPVRKYIESMRKSAVEASEVIQDLLTLSRRGRYDMTPVDLNEVVQACIDSAPFRNLTSRKPQVAVTLRLCDSVTAMNGSFPHLQKLVGNLLANAFEAIDTAGEVTVTTARRCLETLPGGYTRIDPGEYVTLSVRDTGRGIPAADLDKIFEPYYIKKMVGAGGTGLGLSVVYGVVKDHGGYYDVFSEPQRGSEFVVYFRTIQSPVAARPPVGDFSGRGENILVVDDAAAQRDLASELLTGLGYRVAAAENGRQALRYLDTHVADLIVLDMIMEDDFDGLDTYREILLRRPDQRTVIVSGYSSTERVQEMQRLGAGAYIRKPYSLESLGRAVREELDRAVGDGAPSVLAAADPLR
ncbi:MAG TPA: PocR ligand-binding domain-containing protein [candidate division Zixibacteria bacterium]|nr:PocR ligand-binding domain-containing protein [candidate division Zixibacteria bacterium]MDD4916763.1 PocR ligand-binding domain-containing protein [candidate division Zixibacteria bacterium]MDM7973796.1 PocR ligand-binding domain-containing protein [candidate division Zixibacteria bacterium]HOD65341.1 PocR ligand-binding domain-containing protein [candidate division Zixibacteria bacterium]HPM38003.1 PocR ligand-binding domain-containing protein [candidate division Zixibacteria bacterium]